MTTSFPLEHIKDRMCLVTLCHALATAEYQQRTDQGDKEVVNDIMWAEKRRDYLLTEVNKQPPTTEEELSIITRMTIYNATNLIRVIVEEEKKEEEEKEKWK